MANSLWGRLDDVQADAGYDGAHPPRMGFFTDTSVCIGCKACEVACKEWNAVPDDGYELSGMSYDNTQALGASTWRHVAFVEKPLETSAGKPLTTTDLEIAAASYERQITEVVEADEDVRDYVQRLERDDEVDGTDHGPIDEATLPSGEALAAELERYLREQRDD